MRIISGSLKGKTIFAPKNLPVRPTTDFAKEALFNILGNLKSLDEVKVLDLFSGTGNITYEFASRGAKHVVCVDRNFNCFRFIKKTTKELEMSQVIALKYDVFKYLDKCTETFDLIFADPPYDIKNISDVHKIVFDRGLLANGGILVIEHGRENDLKNLEYFLEHRKYGNVNFSLFSLNHNQQ